MPTSFIVFLIGAVLTAGASVWVLRAYRRADGGASVRAAPAFATCAVLIAVALGAYLLVGRPDLADAPYQERLEALKQRDPTSFNADEALAVLSEAAREHPADPLPHLYSGEVLLETGRNEEAARAFDAALRRQPQLAAAMLGLGRALVRIDDGRVSPESQRLFEQAGALTNDPAPWIYQAMAAMQEDRAADARRFWGEALLRMTPDDARRAMAQRMSAETGR